MTRSAAATAVAAVLAASVSASAEAKVVSLRPGAVVVVAGSKLVCSDTTTGGRDAVVCELAAGGRIVAKTYVVGLRENGEAVVLRSDAQGGLSTVFSRKPQAAGRRAATYPLLIGDSFTLAGTPIICSILPLSTRRPVVTCALRSGTSVKTGSYGVILTETFASVVRYDKSGSKVVFSKDHGR